MLHATEGNRSHQGLDIISVPGELIKSPIKGILLREAIPYPNDPSYKGVVIKGTGEYKGYEIKLFYIEGTRCGNINAGEIIGRAQNLSGKYPGITNHIHMEVRRNGVIVSPGDFFNYCF